MSPQKPEDAGGRDLPTPLWQSVSAEEAGLSARAYAELRDELADHLDCQQRWEGEAAARESRSRLEKPQTLRRLASVQLAEQLRATLNRRPSRGEWHELLWLAFWFVLIIAGDLLALHSEGLRGTSRFWDWKNLPREILPWSTGAWLLQAVSRAGFFASFAVSLINAWRIGPGVCLARILQLKLIHTVLVIAATAWLGRSLWQSYGYSGGLRTDWPLWLDAGTILAAGIALTTFAWLAMRRRPAVLIFGLLTTLFLYCGGPMAVRETEFMLPLLREKTIQADGSILLTANMDRAAIEEYARRRAQKGEPLSDEEISSGYRILDKTNLVKPYPFQVFSSDVFFDSPQQNQRAVIDQSIIDLSHQDFISSPLILAGAGIGWLAAPIPLLGIIGLVGMALVLGRRGASEMALYGTLCIIAIVTTILPFTFVQDRGGMLDLTARGVVGTPVPGFESLLQGYHMQDSYLIIVGLLISAGIPWLLTSLFLGEGSGSRPPDEAEVAE